MRTFEEFIGKTEAEAKREGTLDEWSNLKYCFDFALRSGARTERDQCAGLFAEDSVERLKILNRHGVDLN